MTISSSLLNESNFTLFAAQNYTRSCLDPTEFYSDIFRFKYLKRLLRKYNDKQELQERLVLNHLIIIHNIFQCNAATSMCFFKMPETYWPALKTFLIYLNYLKPGEYPTVPCDVIVIKALQKI
jgi:hypothetical protein